MAGMLCRPQCDNDGLSSNYRTLNREGFGQLVMQLSLCILLWQVTLLVGFQREQVNDSLICLVLAVMTHHLTLASLMWAALMAHHVYSLLGRNADIHARCFICKRVFLAWCKLSFGSIEIGFSYVWQWWLCEIRNHILHRRKFPCWENEFLVSKLNYLYIDGIVQERRNLSALAMELRLSCTKPSI